MRLTPAQIDTIQSTVHAVLGEGAQVTLFGSRVDDNVKGGDIDLLVELTAPVPNKTQAIGQIYAKLIRQLGDRKIDILLSDSSRATAPVIEVARQTGVRL
jgi:predicted nucleotidyltransferase